MADTYEKNLSQKSSLTTSDYIRVVGSNNESYKQLVSDVAKKVIEVYTGSTLAGSAQSVKSAIDSLNSNTEWKTVPATVTTKADALALIDSWVSANGCRVGFINAAPANAIGFRNTGHHFVLLANSANFRMLFAIPTDGDRIYVLAKYSGTWGTPSTVTVNQ